MFLLKLTIVPVFIGLVTLATRRWGHGVGGMLAGLPFVAGPIIVFVALDHGTVFAQQMAVSAVSGVCALAVFSLTYCWTCSRFPISIAVCLSSLSWLVAALAVNHSSPSLTASVVLAGASLLAATFLLPEVQPGEQRPRRFDDLYLRMLIGAGLTVLVTALAAGLGPGWSGTVSVFPVIGVVLAIFVQISSGPGQVVAMYRGMFNGLYSFVTFFVCLALLWPDASIAKACVYALAASLGMQVLVQLWTQLQRGDGDKLRRDPHR